MKILFIMLSLINFLSKENTGKEVSKNQMTVSWEYKEERIYFKMMAPTNGWVTIGFNSTVSMSGAYLLMGRVVNDKAELIEHYTIGPGNYEPITTLGANAAVQNIKGSEVNKQTTIQFSLPIEVTNKYARQLKSGSEYVMTLAYSREDDFQHHSMMRTSINVKL